MLTVRRGSAKHRIMAELERYPRTWFRWYQFPILDDVTQDTIQRSISRLVRDGLVDHRLVYDWDESGSGSSRRAHGFRYSEIHHRAEGDD